LLFISVLSRQFAVNLAPLLKIGKNADRHRNMVVVAAPRLGARYACCQESESILPIIASPLEMS